MQELLQQLDQHLAALRPGYYAQLQVPLDEAAINNLEQQYGRKLPDDLRQLYCWRNGQRDDCYDSFVNNSMFLPLEHALDIAVENTSMIGLDFEEENWWHVQWLPLWHNGGGDYICHDMGGLFTGQAGQLIEFWHADADRNVIAPNLQTFINALNQYYKSTPAGSFDDYFSIDEAIHDFPRQFKAGI